MFSNYSRSCGASGWRKGTPEGSYLKYTAAEEPRSGVGNLRNSRPRPPRNLSPPPFEPLAGTDTIAAKTGACEPAGVDAEANRGTIAAGARRRRDEG